MDKGIEDIIKVLKDPLSYRFEEITESLFYVTTTKDKESWIDIVVGKVHIGVSVRTKEFPYLFDMQVYKGVTQHLLRVKYLEKYFRHPLLPTGEEKVLFQIEFGVDYPLKSEEELRECFKETCER